MRIDEKMKSLEGISLAVGTAAAIVPIRVVARVTSVLGGNDFFSGIPGESITLTAGMSFTSSMRAASYCWVRSSSTVS